MYQRLWIIFVLKIKLVCFWGEAIIKKDSKYRNTIILDYIYKNIITITIDSIKNIVIIKIRE